MFNKREVAQCLFTAVRKSFAAQKKKDGIDRGISLIFHSDGKGLSYHPHIHCLVSIGGLTKKQQWVERSFSYNDIESTYRSVLKKELVKLVKSKDFRNPPGMDCLKEIFSLHDKSFRIFQSQVYKSGEGVLSYLSKSIKSGPITEDDILEYNDKEVILKCRDSKETVTLKVEEFILRYLNHIPPKKFMVVRNLGLYANTNANKTKEYKRGLGIEIDEGEYQIPKLVCPKCGKQVVRVEGMSKKKLNQCCLEKCA
jgi:hypothetical protein